MVKLDLHVPFRGARVGIVWARGVRIPAQGIRRHVVLAGNMRDLGDAERAEYSSPPRLQTRDLRLRK